MKPSVFDVGSRVRKIGGSYQATGTILAVFITRNGEQRFVFDFDEPPGLLHIFGPAQIEPVEEPPKLTPNNTTRNQPCNPISSASSTKKPNLILR